ncbi:conserved exported protein of unknown function [Nitrospira sp. KM1]|uniref:phosphodiester glycosidase family protein n=1 Tax=Nitrospira sp. KM1 TaxID=1936990 RepID=UPI0013A740BB|nr:phosphodiester glycosidase family protein [Nitrospira sp. KM1]BCA55378.1 conserved exported protein of unknown function [Nitrospira sp. KM1]
MLRDLSLGQPGSHLRSLFFCAWISVACSGSVGWAGPIVWDRIADGLAVSLWTPESCPAVPPMVAIEIDPDRYRFSVHQYQNERLDVPPDIHEWQARTGHDLVFNAGLFRENFSYLGLLYANGRSLGGKPHTTWMGLFTAEPTNPDAARARIFDLTVDSFDERRVPYREAAQSLMLLDEGGTVRVKRTGKQAQQTIVAEQRNGKIMLLKTTQPAALYEIGQCLREGMFTIRRAMAMDGGSSSDVALAAPLHRIGKTTAGGEHWMPFLDDQRAGHIGLPAVIGITPRHAHRQGGGP